MRTCRHCQTAKPADAFPANHRMRDGLSSWCKACHVARTREWRQHNRHEINARRRKPRRPEHDHIRRRGDLGR